MGHRIQDKRYSNQGYRNNAHLADKICGTMPTWGTGYWGTMPTWGTGFVGQCLSGGQDIGGQCLPGGQDIVGQH